MKKLYEMELQLFGEGSGGAASGATVSGAGDGGAPAVTGNTPAADSGEYTRLKELGVPDDVLERRAKRSAKKNRGESAPAMTAAPEGSTAESRPAEQIQPRSFLRQDVRSHYGTMQRQAEAMGQKYPDFNLQKELQNPTFFHLTSPHVGLSVEDAYMAVHHREVMQAITQGARQEFANSVRAGGNRPAEHGIGAKAPAMVTFDYKNASRSEREAFKKRIYDAAARGEKIYPGR